MTIEEVQDNIVAQFKDNDWMQIYQKLIKYGISVESADIKYKNEDSIIPGCQNKVWISGTKNKDNLVNYIYDSDSTIIRGIIYLIMSVVDKRTPQEIIDCKLTFIEDIGLADQISNLRGNGLQLILDKIYNIAKSLA